MNKFEIIYKHIYIYIYIYIYLVCTGKYNFGCINVMVTKCGYQYFREILLRSIELLPLMLSCHDRPDIMDNIESFIGTRII